MEGRPGDHPVTDMLYHGATLVDPEIDDLLRRLRKTESLANVKRFWETELHQVEYERDRIVAQLTERIERRNG